MGVQDETAKSEIVELISGVDLFGSYIPAAWIGRNAKGPDTHHQIRDVLDGDAFEGDTNQL